MRLNKYVTQIVAGTVSSSILLSSCTPVNIDENVYSTLAVGADDVIGEPLLPISVNLNPEDALYIQALSKFARDIIRDRNVAAKFKENPSEVLKGYGYLGIINLDDSLMNLIVALGDRDIHDAIIRKDVKKFLSLCIDKGLLRSESIFASDFYKQQFNVLNNEDVINMPSPLSIDWDSAEPGEDGGDGVGLFFMAGAVAIAVVAVVVVAGVEVVMNVQAAVDTFVTFIGRSNNARFTELGNNADNVISTFDSYALKTASDDIYVVIDEYMMSIVDQTVDLIKEKRPDYFLNNSEKDFRKILLVNLTKGL